LFYFDNEAISAADRGVKFTLGHAKDHNDNQDTTGVGYSNT